MNDFSLLTPRLGHSDVSSRPGLHHIRYMLGLLIVACLVASCSSSNGSSGPDNTSDVSWLDTTEETDTASDGTDWQPIVDNYAWLPTPADDDPFYATKQDKADLCSPDDYGIEEFADGPWFDITTSFCGYLTVDQAALSGVTKGRLLRLRIWHFQIIAGAGPYHLELSARQPDGTTATIWSADVSVPSSSQLIYEEWPSPVDIAPGASLYWHVSNHGTNTWGFIEFLVAPESE